MSQTGVSWSSRASDGRASASLRANEPAEVLVGELDRMAPFHPCLALRVSDLAGTVADVEPVCLDTTVQPARRLDQGGGCRVAGPGGDARALALVLLWRRPRRQPESKMR